MSGRVCNSMAMASRQNRGAVALRRWRLEEGLTHDQASKCLGVSPSTYTRLERGVLRPKLDLAVWIEDHLDISVRLWLKASRRSR